jgi:hypothetical protein
MAIYNTLLERTFIYVEHELYKVAQNKQDKHKMYQRLK